MPPNGGTSWSLAKRATVERCSEASGASYNPDAREVAMAAMRRRSVTCSKLHRMATRLGKDTATAELCHLDYEADADAGPPPQPSATALNGSAARGRAACGPRAVHAVRAQPGRRGQLLRQGRRVGGRVCALVRRARHGLRPHLGRGLEGLQRAGPGGRARCDRRAEGGEPKEALSPALGRAGASCVLSALLWVSLVAPVRTRHVRLAPLLRAVIFYILRP